MEHIRKLEAGNDEFWMKDNSYWVSTVTNYILWGWPPAAICSDAAKAQNLTAKDIQAFLVNGLNTSNYSVLGGFAPNPHQGALPPGPPPKGQRSSGLPSISFAQPTFNLHSHLTQKVSYIICKHLFYGLRLS